MNSNIKIPEPFLDVLKKMNPEISNLEFVSANTISYGRLPLSSEDSELIIVNVRVCFINDPHIVGDTKVYTSILNTYFKCTYPDMGFVSFYVTQLKIPPKLSNRDKFALLFR